MTNNYNPYAFQYNPYQPSQPVQQNLPRQEIIGVNGKEGINQLQLGPNSSIFAYDKSTSGPYGFIKATDEVGIATVKRVKLVFLDDDVKEEKPIIDAADSRYVLKSDFDELSKKVTSMWEELNGKSN